MIPLEALGQPSCLFQLLVVPASLACGPIPSSSVSSHGLLTLYLKSGATVGTPHLGSSQHGDWMPVGESGGGEDKSRQGREGKGWGECLSYGPLEAVSITPTTFCWSKE